MPLYVFNESHQNSNHKNPELMLILGSQFLFPAEKFISKRTSSKNQLLWYQLAQESARVEFFFNVFSEFLPFMNLPEKVSYILKFSLGKHFPFLILWVFFLSKPLIFTSFWRTCFPLDQRGNNLFLLLLVWLKFEVGAYQSDLYGNREAVLAFCAKLIMFNLQGC